MLPLIFDTCVPRYEFYWEIEIMKVADLTYLLVPRLCLVTHIRRLCLPSFPATNEAEPRLNRFPGRALEAVNFMRRLI